MLYAWLVSLSVGVVACELPAADALIRVQADEPGPAVSRLQMGACIEDVNHELYGGIASQMIFGESFQEPAATLIDGFRALGTPGWVVQGGVLGAPAGDGPKLVLDRPGFASGSVSVEVRFADDADGNAGLIVKLDQPGPGADQFHGYEVALDPKRQRLVVGRHRNNWEPIHERPCPVPLGQWIGLTVLLSESGLTVLVGNEVQFEYVDSEHPLHTGTVALRTWKRPAQFRNLQVRSGAEPELIAFQQADPGGVGGVSGMWRPVAQGNGQGRLSLESENPFVGSQSQRITLTSSAGAVGIENRGLNRQGMAFATGKPYEGFLWIRAERAARVEVGLEPAEGGQALARAALDIVPGGWKRYDFDLTPASDEGQGRFAVWLTEPGSVVLGHAYLQPGAWGRFQNLPVRKDVADGLISAGVTVMRLGGLMANAPGYRLKQMIGPRDRRQPYQGFWYPQSSNGWGILEFLDFCEAAGFVPVVDLNLDETPADLADFLEYVNGPVDSQWGRLRAEAGHPAPYGLRYIELGNEESVDEAYWLRFRPLAETAWARDPGVVLIVGDFDYSKPIIDPFQFEGAPRIKTLAAHQKMLELAKQHQRPLWFDVHIWNHNPGEGSSRVAALKTFDAALTQICPGAEHRICVLEENATNHAVRRAIAHAETVTELMQMGEAVPIVCAANALQVDRQNDNGWDQGLVFLNPAAAWLQPPAYVTQMLTKHYQPRVVGTTVSGDEGALRATATRDGQSVVLRVTNLGDSPRAAHIDINGFTPRGRSATVEELTGPIDAVNTAESPTQIQPRTHAWQFDPGGQPGSYTFPPYSFTVLRFE